MAAAAEKVATIAAKNARASAEETNMHAHTNLLVNSEFLPVRLEVEPEDGLTRVHFAEIEAS